MPRIQLRLTSQGHLLLALINARVWTDYCPPTPIHTALLEQAELTGARLNKRYVSSTQIIPIALKMYLIPPSR